LSAPAGATLDGIEHGEGIEPQHRLPHRAPPLGGDRAILALGVDDDRPARPGQQVGDDDADALAGAGRRESSGAGRRRGRGWARPPAPPHRPGW